MRGSVKGISWLGKKVSGEKVGNEINELRNNVDEVAKQIRTKSPQ